MTMQRVHLDISSDIFDKVIFFLENLPKNKVKFSIDKKLNTDQSKNTLGEFFQSSPLVDTISLERNQESYHSRIEL